MWHDFRMEQLLPSSQIAVQSIAASRLSCNGNVVSWSLQALAADDAAFPAWQSRHKAQLRGSSRVLAALQAAYPDSLMPLLGVPAKRAAFVALMPALQQRHQYALRSGKGWQVGWLC
jgi:hypothetical protein